MTETLKSSDKFILAMYDIRGKQKYIYRSRKIKEIVGGSMIIRDLFKDYLFTDDLAGEKAKYRIFNNKNVKFTETSFRKHIEEGYAGEVIYDGGGNFLVMFKNRQVYDYVTYEFTKKVIENTATLNVLPAWVPVSSFDNFHCNKRDKDGRSVYLGDYEKLYEIHRLNEAMDTGVRPWGTLPLAAVDPMTSMPLTKTIEVAYSKKTGKVNRRVTAESVAKYSKYDAMDQDDRDKIGARVLDDMVEEKGKDSLLAVIYLDGNNMGAQIKNCIDRFTSYEGCVEELRKFSRKIQSEYIEGPLEAVDKKLFELRNDGNQSRRMIVYSGDEVTFICNAHDAYEIVNTYFQSLTEGDSSCAGICIFQSHMPYADAYRLAEECCENGKKKMREGRLSNVCFLDYHYCQGAIGLSLEEIREHENEGVISRPWLMRSEASEKEKLSRYPDRELIETFGTYFNLFGRSNIKELGVHARYSETEFLYELERIKAHMKEGKDTVRFDLLKENAPLVYDVAIVYDLWFRKGEVNE